MWPFIRSRYYFLSYKAYVTGRVGGGWRMRRMKCRPDKAISYLVKEIEGKVGAEIVVTAFYVVR